MAVFKKSEVKTAVASVPVPVSAPVPAQTPAFPAIPTDGSRWDGMTHEQAVKAYEAALAEGNPDAGRMRTLLGMYGYPGAELQSAPAVGVAFKSQS